MSIILNSNIHDQNITPNSAIEFLEYITENENVSNNDILIVPTEKYSRKLQLDAIKLFFNKHNKPSGKFHIYSFRSFIKYVYNKYFINNSIKIISDSIVYNLLYESIDDNCQFYTKSSFKNPYNFLKIAGLIYGLKKEGIEPFYLLEELSNPIHQKSRYKQYSKIKNKDIFHIYSNYENKLKGKYFDFFSIQKYLIATIKNEELNVLFKNDLNFVLFDGFSDFTRLDLDFINSIKSCLINVKISLDYIDFDYNGKNEVPLIQDTSGPLFGNIRKIRADLLQSGFKIEYDEDNEIENIANEKLSFVNYLRRWLFNTEIEIKNKQIYQDLTVLETQGNFEEVNSITKLVKYLINNEEFKPNEICICSRNPQLYSEFFKQTFFINRIPSNITDRPELTRSIISKFIFNILYLFEYNFDLSELKILLKNKFIKNSAFQKVQESDLLKDLISLNYRKTNIKNSQYIRLFLKNEIDKLNKAEKRKTSTNWTNYDNKKIVSLNNSLEAFNILIELIDIPSYKMTPNIFLGFINKIIDNFHIIESIIEFEDYFIANDNTSSYDKIQFRERIEIESKAIIKFQQTILEFCDILNDKDSKFEYELNFYINSLKTILETTRYQINEKHNYGVTITSIEQIRGINFKIYILCGMDYTQFPIEYKTEYLLGRELKESEARHSESEKMLFFQFFNNAFNINNNYTPKIYLTYSNDGFDSTNSKSDYISELFRIFDINTINYFKLSQFKNNKEFSASLPWLNTITNIGELFEKNYYQKDVLFYLNENNLLNSNYINTSLFENELIEIDENNINNKIESLSSSYIQTYLDCPFKFFVSKKLKLSEQNSIDNFVNELDHGNIIHNVLFQFFELQKQNQNFISEYSDLNPNMNKNFIFPIILDINNKNKYLLELGEIAVNEIEKLSQSENIKKFLKRDYLGYKNNKGILELYLDKEFELQNKYWGFKPSLFEFDINTNHDIKYNGIPLKGKIDRVDVIKSNDGIYYFNLIDYKNSAANKLNDKIGAKSNDIQLPLYFYMFNEIVRKNKIEYAIASLTYYSTKFQDEKKIIYTLNKINNKKYFDVNDPIINESVAKLRDVVELRLKKVDDAIQGINSQNFKVSPFNVNTVCSNCNFRSACRIQQKPQKY